MSTTFADHGIVIPAHATGVNVKTTCPKCSHTRKHRYDKPLSVHVEKGVWRCHNCGWKGGLGVDWRDDVFGIGRREPPRVYAKPEPVTADLPAAVIQWFGKRGITEATLRRNGIAAKGGAILFPYLRDGELINVKRRTPDKRFSMVAGAERIFYGLDDCRDADDVIVVEGEIDKLSLDEAGFLHVLSVPDGAPSPNTTAYTSKFDFMDSAADIFARAQIVVLAVDNDEPGKRLEEELARRIGREKCFRVTWPEGCKDANDVLVRHGAAVLEQCIQDARPYPIAGIVMAMDLRDDVFALYRDGSQRGESTGWYSVDQLYTVKPGQMTILTGIPGSGKALAIDTRIPTPDGWTTMGDIQVGDRVFDESGRPCSVVGATDVMVDRPCFRITFSDHTSVVCDADHQWMTRDDRARRSAYQASVKGRSTPRPVMPRGSDQTHLRTFPSTKTTREIAQSVTAEKGKRLNHAVPVSGELKLPEVDLAVDPYVLGAWLGDGSSAHGGFTCADQQIIDEILAAGYAVTKWGGRLDYGIDGLKPALREIGVLGNKHIPASYLRASSGQRLALLQGLMDTDGYATRQGSCEFTSTNMRLALGVYELVASLGAIPTFRVGRATIAGKDCGEKYRVRFTPSFAAFRLQRKLDRITKTRSARLGWRYIVSCEPVPSVPVRCIQVDSPSHLYLCTDAMIPTHNSEWLDALMVNLAQGAGWSFAVFSPENFPPQRHVQKWLEKLAGKPFRAGPTPRMTEAEVDAWLAFCDAHLHFLVPEEPTLDEILGLAGALVFRFGVKGVVLDPWNEIDHSRPRDMSETEYISRCLSEIRRFARQKDVHCWVSAHPRMLQKDKQTGEYLVPTPYEIAGSAHWYNKSDNCIAVWRNKHDDTEPIAIHVQKIRFREIGALGVAYLAYDKVTGQYHDTGQYEYAGGRR